MYCPNSYTRTQLDWLSSTFAHDGCIDYASAARTLHVSDARSFIAQHSAELGSHSSELAGDADGVASGATAEAPSGAVDDSGSLGVVFLSTCAVSSRIIDSLQEEIIEASKSPTWIDLTVCFSHGYGSGGECWRVRVVILCQGTTTLTTHVGPLEEAFPNPKVEVEVVTI